MIRNARTDDSASDDDDIRRVHICHDNGLSMVALRSTALLLLLSPLICAAPEAPPFALSDDAVPRRYFIELTVDPDRDSFDGLARIEVDLRKRLPVIWLNA